jgi:hypothetical protein
MKVINEGKKNKKQQNEQNEGIEILLKKKWC